MGTWAGPWGRSPYRQKLPISPCAFTLAVPSAGDASLTPFKSLSVVTLSGTTRTVFCEMLSQALCPLCRVPQVPVLPGRSHSLPVRLSHWSAGRVGGFLVRPRVLTLSLCLLLDTLPPPAGSWLAHCLSRPRFPHLSVLLCSPPPTWPCSCLVAPGTPLSFRPPAPLHLWEGRAASPGWAGAPLWHGATLARVARAQRRGLGEKVLWVPAGEGGQPPTQRPPAGSSPGDGRAKGRL